MKCSCPHCGKEINPASLLASGEVSAKKRAHLAAIAKLPRPGAQGKPKPRKDKRHDLQASNMQ